ncbi:MAG: radical SAM protein [Acidobacteria bacterium]|nr:radical SAM protein [Acidobacteriota bacterium]
MLTVNEIFHSIQGESSHAGRPCVFVRLTACDLRCTWCDSPYAFHEGVKMSVDDIVAAVTAYGCGLVEMTGGEPLLQKELYPLMDRLHEAGLQVLIETGGHRSIAQVPAYATIVMDVKCPGSGEAAKHDAGNFARLRPHDEVKFVIRDRADYDYACEVLRREGLIGKVADVLFSPVHGVLDAQTLAEWVLADRLPVRMQLQAHKYIWGADVRGV